MARLSGKNGAITLSTATTAGITKWEITLESDALESTGFDTGGFKTNVVGLQGFDGTFTAFKDGAPLTIGSEVAALFKESTTSTQWWSGQIIVTTVKPTTDVAELVSYEYTFVGTGTTGLTIPTA